MRRRREGGSWVLRLLISWRNVTRVLPGVQTRSREGTATRANGQARQRYVGEDKRSGTKNCVAGEPSIFPGCHVQLGVQAEAYATQGKELAGCRR
jgi:hypothetical protein